MSECFRLGIACLFFFFYNQPLMRGGAGVPGGGGALLKWLLLWIYLIGFVTFSLAFFFAIFKDANGKIHFTSTL